MVMGLSELEAPDVGRNKCQLSNTHCPNFPDPEIEQSAPCTSHVIILFFKMGGNVTDYSIPGTSDTKTSQNSSSRDWVKIKADQEDIG